MGKANNGQSNALKSTPCHLIHGVIIRFKLKMSYFQRIQKAFLAKNGTERTTMGGSYRLVGNLRALQDPKKHFQQVEEMLYVYLKANIAVAFRELYENHTTISHTILLDDPDALKKLSTSEKQTFIRWVITAQFSVSLLSDSGVVRLKNITFSAVYIAF